MVRLRQIDGATKPVGDIEAVEILDADNKLAALIFTDRRGVINVLTPGAPAFTAYCHAHGLRAATVHHHEPFAAKPIPP